MSRESRPIRERIRNRTLFREQRPIKGRELVGYLTLSALILLPAVFGLWQQGDYVRTRLEIEARRKETIALREHYRMLRIERATLESLPRIGEEARRCGLVPREEARAPFYLIPPSLQLRSSGARAALGREEALPARSGMPAAAQTSDPAGSRASAGAAGARLQTAGGGPAL
jgi:hypothetical protein